VSIPVLGRLAVLPAADSFQAAATQTVVTTPSGTSTTVTVTPTAPAGTPGATQTPTPAPTVTPNPYPDPNTILRNMFTVYELLRSVHYEQVTDAEQASAEKLHLDAKGDVTCKNQAINGKLSLSDVLEGTSQTTKLNESYVQIKKAVFLKSKGSHNRWIKGKPADLAQFGVRVDYFLFCATPTSSGGGTNNTVVKDLTNLGPDTFQGVAVWHIRATEITVDTAGKASASTLDFLISQDHYLPYVSTVTVNDTTTNIKEVQSTILTQFGKKVNIKAPTIGSTKP
jgi:hypothetical protein